MLTACERNVVKEEVLLWHRRVWYVHAVSVMPDHVHVLVTPLQAAAGHWYPLSEVLRRVKGRSARRINLLRGAKGPISEEESRDRFVRGERDFSATFDYLLSNAGVEGLEHAGLEYDGFWCASMEGVLLGFPAPADQPVPGWPARALVPGDSRQVTRRHLPHQQLGGATYHVTFGARQRARDSAGH